MSHSKKDDCSLALDMETDLKITSSTRKTLMLIYIRINSFKNHYPPSVPLLCLVSTCYHLTASQLSSDSVLWARSLTTTLPWVSLSLSPSLSLSLSLSLFWVSDYRGRWWERRALAFPSHSPEDCFWSERSLPLCLTAPPPLAHQWCGKSLGGGVPLSTLGPSSL